MLQSCFKNINKSMKRIEGNILSSSDNRIVFGCASSTSASNAGQFVVHSVKDQIATITLNSPEKHNALSDVTIAQLDSALTKIKEEVDRGNARALFIKSTGKSFSAGADLQWMKRMAVASKSESKADAVKLAEMLKKLDELPCLTVAFVQGPAYGGGVGLVAACDVAIASTLSSFTLSEVKIGLIPATISPYVVAKIGVSQARRFFLTAEKFTAEQALSFGLVHEVVSGENSQALNEWEEKIKKSILSVSPNAVKESKKLITSVQYKIGDKSMVDTTASLLADIRETKECKDGLTAFFEKKKAPWIHDSKL